MSVFELPISSLLVLLLVSAFIKIFTTLNIARFGIGLDGAGFGLVIGAVSIALSLVVIEPYLSSIPDLAQLNAEQLQANFRPFLEKHTDSKIISRLKSAATGAIKNDNKDQSSSFNLLLASFLIGELKSAFQLGFMLLLPFLLIDLLVTNGLMLLGVSQLPCAVVSLPLKILLFFAVDGWTMVAEKLLRTYQ